MFQRLFLTTLLTISSGVFADMYTEAQTNPVCFGREYSSAHMQNHPNQRVQKMRTKLSYDAEYNQYTLNVEATLRDRPQVNYSANLYCLTDNLGLCVIDCDGGSISVTQQNATAARADQTLLLKNNGFVLTAGCGGDDMEDEKNEPAEEDLVYLEPTADGDDYFLLQRLPDLFCQRTH